MSTSNYKPVYKDILLENDTSEKEQINLNFNSIDKAIQYIYTHDNSLDINVQSEHKYTNEINYMLFDLMKHLSVKLNIKCDYDYCLKRLKHLIDCTEIVLEPNEDEIISDNEEIIL